MCRENFEKFPVKHPKRIAKCSVPLQLPDGDDFIGNGTLAPVEYKIKNVYKRLIFRASDVVTNLARQRLVWPGSEFTIANIFAAHQNKKFASFIFH